MDAKQFLYFLAFMFFKIKLTMQSSCLCVLRSEEYHCKTADKFSFIDRVFRKKFNLYAIQLANSKLLDVDRCSDVDMQHILYSQKNSRISIRNVGKIENQALVSEFHKLSILDMINSNVEQMPILTNLTSLWRLDMSHNKISHLNHSRFFPLSLEYLFLHNNNISEVSIDCFSLLKNLKLVDLSKNQLTDVSFDFNIGTLGSLFINLNKNFELAYIREITLNSKYQTTFKVEAHYSIIKKLPLLNITHKNAAFEIKPHLVTHRRCSSIKCALETQFSLFVYLEF